MSANYVTNRRAKLVASIALLPTVILAGCHLAAPPLYRNSWRSINARCPHDHLYCHGFTPTQWSRWPDECQGPEVIYAEEIPHPTPPTPTPAQPVPLVEPKPIFDEPPVATPPDFPDAPSPDATLPDAPTPESPFVPQSYDSDDSPPSDDASPWTSRLHHFWGEVTTLR